ncbi:outer membrane protein [Rhizobium glycinendophyticum]|uniref:Porin family protein n=1 Tax=Rhizobium glycinendophyticum TaxID=2589807 RepID=A0A504UI32_9HYPH|nr:outer membrane protein [Rhizobium glycinendophyticum]TPP06531.1 porin family protein [Rhizobium glycinendophyticum]
MWKVLSIGAALALLLSGVTQAADAVQTAPASPPEASAVSSFSWAGGYVGLHAGYGWGEGDAAAGGASGTIDFDGGRFGGFAGYNVDLGSSVIVGIEGDLGYDWNEREDGTETFGSNIHGAVRGRVGYAVDRALVYAAGGWAATQFSYDDTGVSIDETMNGWTVGAGVDYAINDRIFVRAEYRYNDYGNADVGAVNIDFTQHVVQAGLGLKF